MSMWILILIVYQVSYDGGVAVKDIQNFRSAAECNVAATQIASAAAIDSVQQGRRINVRFACIEQGKK